MNAMNRIQTERYNFKIIDFYVISDVFLPFMLWLIAGKKRGSIRFSSVPVTTIENKLATPSIITPAYE